MSTISRLGFVTGLALLGAAATPLSASRAEALPGAAVKSALPEAAQATQVAHRRSHKARRHARARVHVAPPYGPGFVGFGAPVYGYAHRYPGVGGYAFDPARIGSGGAYQGNIPGCAVDLGYGRYESCNVGR